MVSNLQYLASPTTTPTDFLGPRRFIPDFLTPPILLPPDFFDLLMRTILNTSVSFDSIKDLFSENLALPQLWKSSERWWMIVLGYRTFISFETFNLFQQHKTNLRTPKMFKIISLAPCSINHRSGNGSFRRRCPCSWPQCQMSTWPFCRWLVHGPLTQPWWPRPSLLPLGSFLRWDASNLIKLLIFVNLASSEFFTTKISTLSKGRKYISLVSKLGY